MLRFSNSGYVDEFGSIVLDRTQLVSRVYQVTASTTLTQGANTITLNPGDLACEYTIRRVGDVRRGAFASVPELIKAVLDYVAQHNDDPKPFIWRKTAQEIIEKVGRARFALHNAPTA